MLKAMVPMPTATRRRRACSPSTKLPQDSRKLTGFSATAGPRLGRRVSCCHSASMFSTMVATAEPWITCTSRPGVKSCSKAPKTSALTMLPSNSITYIRPTTLG